MLEIEPLGRILCAVDFSDATPLVAAHARRLAIGMNAEVLVLYVSPSMNRYAKLYVAPDMIGALEQEIIEGARKQMDACLKEHFQGVRARGMVEIGYAPEAIVAVAARESAGLVVMGTHGRRGVGSIVFGSVAEKVVKSSRIPVLTVRP